MTSVALVHGWGGSFATTWQSCGFTALLEDAGKDVIGIDLLGHGEAPKPHDPDAYADLTDRILEALPDEPVDAIGFSLGAITLLRAAIDHPERFSRLVLAGVGANVLDRTSSGVEEVIAGLEKAIAGESTDGLDNQPRLFVQYAQQPGNDIEALTAVMKRPAAADLQPEEIATVTCPVLVVVGDRDFVHPADQFAECFPDGRLVVLPGVDHFATTEAFGFFDAALEFVGAI